MGHYPVQTWTWLTSAGPSMNTRTVPSAPAMSPKLLAVTPFVVGPAKPTDHTFALWMAESTQLGRPVASPGRPP